MPTTSEGFYYPDSSTSLSLVTILAAMAASSDAAHKTVPVPYNTVSARNAAVPSPTEGRVVVTTDYDILWVYTGTQWRHVGSPSFASSTIRDAQITQPASGDLCSVAGVQYAFDGSNWNRFAPTLDTGWVTSGITFTYPGSPNWTVNSYRIRKVEDRVTGVLNVTNTAAITVGSDGNFNDQDICTPPTAWRNGSGFSPAVRIDRAGFGSWFGRAESGGAIKITHGMPSTTLPAGTPCQVYIDYYTN